MKRVLLSAAGVLSMLMVALAGPALPVSQAANATGAGTNPTNFSFTAPVNVTQQNGIHPAVLGAFDGGAVDLPYQNAQNTEVNNSYNLTLGGPFQIEQIDQSDNIAGNLRMVSDTQGRVHLAWYHNNGDGSTEIYYARKDSPTAHWQTMAIPGSRTGPPGNTAYKVVGIARGPNDRIYVMWARNGVGVRVSYTDDGSHWAPVDVVPGPFNSLSTDFNIGATTSGYVFVGWFERSPNDIFVSAKPPGGTWGTRTDVTSRPNKGQDYSPRFGTAPDGGLRFAWTGVATSGGSEADPFYREWTPSGGWSANIVQLVADSGDMNSRAVELMVDATGMSHIVWDDDTGRGAQNVTAYYVQGRGTTFTTPQQIVPQFGQATARYPYIDVANAAGGSTIHVVMNSNVAGAFDNWYTYAGNGAAVSPTPVATATPCIAGQFKDVAARLDLLQCHHRPGAPWGDLGL